MLRFLILLAVLFAIALGFHQLKDTAGDVTLTLAGTAYRVDLTTAVIALIALVAAVLILFSILRALFNLPHRLGRGWRQRNATRANWAVSQGLIAVASGDQRTAERAALEAARRAPDQPLTLLLQAQTAQMRGDRTEARRSFAAMAGDEQTRIAGLRGLYIEAEREGDRDAARQIAEQAHAASASAPWAAWALLQHQSAASDWEGALKTLSGAADNRILDKRSARRQRAVLLTGLAMDEEERHPDRARQAATEAHDLAPDFVPAAVVAGRLLSRQGDIRRAARILENTWKVSPHPEIADVYAHVRIGDSAQDRLKRMEVLHRLRPQADEGRLALARAAIDARDFARAREALTPVLTNRPTQNALFVMADLVEAESGDHGMSREWLARAVRAPRDPAWTADGVVLEHWAPVSPISGRIDAVEWKVPLAELEGPALQIDAAALSAPAPREDPAVELPVLAQATAAPSQSPAKPEPPAQPVTTHAETAPLPASAVTIRGNGHGSGASAAAEGFPPADLGEAPEEVGLPELAIPPRPDDPGVDADPADEDQRVRGF